MKRKEFLNKCTACGAVSLLALFNPDTAGAQENNTSKDDADSEPMNKSQIRQLLKFIDSSINETDKEKIFNKLGTECLYSRNLNKWVVSFRDQQDEFFNRVKRGEAKYWEILEYDKDKSLITLVGKKFKTCVCEYGQCDEPPESLCNYCCKRFQEELFGLLLDKKVRVKINESIILGGERCSSTIYVG